MSTSSIDIDKVIAMINELPVIENRIAGTSTVWDKANQVLFDVRGMRLGQLPLNDYVAFRGEWESWLRQALAYAYMVRDQPVNMSTVRNVIQIDGDIDAAIATSPPGLLPTEQEAAGVRIGDIIANGGTLTAEDWDTLMRYSHNPEFANGLFTNCNEEQLAQFTIGESNAMGHIKSQYGDDPDGSAQQLIDDQYLSYVQHLQALSNVLSTWASMPNNSDKVADIIVASLQGHYGPDVEDGMKLLISSGPFDAYTTLRVADAMYDFSQSGGDTREKGTNTCIFPGDPLAGHDPTIKDSFIISDGVVAVMLMLAKSPPAAAVFFSDMDGATNVTIDLDGQTGGETRSIPVSPHIQWAIDYPWDWIDEGRAAGAALATASCPLAGDQLTVQQSQVGSQTLIFIASMKQTNHDWVPPSGIGNGAALIIAGNPASLYAASPYMSPGNTNHVIVPDVPVSANGLVGSDGSNGLSVNATVLGTVIQAISQDPANIDTVMIGWAIYLPSFFYTNVDSSESAMMELFAHPTTSSALSAADTSASVLSFIVDNALAGRTTTPAEADALSQRYYGLASTAINVAFSGVHSTPLSVFVVLGQGALAAADERLRSWWQTYNQTQADNTRQASEQIEMAGMDESSIAYRAYIQFLTDAGFFATATIQAWNDQNPTWPLPDPPPGLQPGARVDLDDADTSKWLADSDIALADNVIASTQPGHSTDQRFVVPLP